MSASSRVQHSDSYFMLRALALARRGMGLTYPNPPVGAVITKDGVVVGEGFHPRAGEAHAERIAIERAGSNANGGTLYVTLEPCNHFGRTPPCADAIISAKIARVVFSVSDPNTKVAGGGAKKLHDAGIEITTQALENIGLELLSPWKKSLVSAYPYVTLKLAVSSNGWIAPVDTGNFSLTGPASKAMVQRFRSRVDAIGVGITTILKDDPQLTNRTYKGNKPLKVVFDSSLKTPRTARIFQNGDVLIFCSEGSHASLERSEFTSKLSAKSFPNISIVEVLSKDSRLDLADTLRNLRQRGYFHFLCEGGGEISSSLLRENLVDQLVLFRTPICIPDRGVAWCDDDFTLTDKFDLTHERQAGRDAIQVWDRIQS